jgi:hypothetical protein
MLHGRGGDGGEEYSGGGMQSAPRGAAGKPRPMSQPAGDESFSPGITDDDVPF